MDSGSSLYNLPTQTCVDRSLPKRDICIIIVVAVLVYSSSCCQSEEFQELVVPSGKLIGIFQVLCCRLQGLRVRGWGENISRLNDSNKLILIRTVTLQVKLMRIEPQRYLITEDTSAQCILGLLE